MPRADGFGFQKGHPYYSKTMRKLCEELARECESLATHQSSNMGQVTQLATYASKFRAFQQYFEQYGAFIFPECPECGAHCDYLQGGNICQCFHR